MHFQSNYNGYCFWTLIVTNKIALKKLHIAVNYLASREKELIFI